MWEVQSRSNSVDPQRTINNITIKSFKKSCYNLLGTDQVSGEGWRRTWRRVMLFHESWQWVDGSDRIRGGRALKLARQANTPLCWIRQVNLCWIRQVSLSALALFWTRSNPDFSLASPLRAQVSLTPPWDAGSVPESPGGGCKV